MINFGDSITVGVGASPSSKSWVGLFTPVNFAVSGSQAAEVSNAVQTAALSDIITLMIGTNDVRIYKDNELKRLYFKRFLYAALAYLARPLKLSARNMTAAGAWANTSVNTFGRVTTQNGASLKATFTGARVYIGYIIQNHISAVSLADVMVDGAKVGEISCDGYTAPMTTQNGTSYAAACDFFDVPEGAHEIEIVCRTNGKNLYINWIATPQPSPRLLVSNVIKLSNAVYSQLGITQKTTMAYNSIVEEAVQHFGATLVDNFSTIDPEIHLADGVHPNNAGHQIIYNNFMSAI